MLPRDEQGLAKMRESLDSAPPRAVPWWLVHDWRSRDEIWGHILLTQEQKVQAAAEFDRREWQRLTQPQSCNPLSILDEVQETGG